METLDDKYDGSMNTNAIANALNNGKIAYKITYDPNSLFVSDINDNGYVACDKESLYASTAKSHFSNGNSQIFSYIMLNGLECVVCYDDILSAKRTKKLKMSFDLKFPFMHIKQIACTDVAYAYKQTVKHIYALESPTTIFNKLGITYKKTTELDLVNDDLEGN